MQGFLTYAARGLGGVFNVKVGNVSERSRLPN